jgi:hypothetical protein
MSPQIVIARNQTQSAVIKYLKTVDLEEIEKNIANDYFIEYKNLGMTEYESNGRYCTRHASEQHQIFTKSPQIMFPRHPVPRSL